MTVFTKLRKLLTNERGVYGTTLVVATIAILSTLGIAVLFTSESDTTATTYDELSKQALYASETGINNYLWKINQNADYAAEETDPAETGWVSTKSGDYRLDVSETDGVPGVVIEATGRNADGDMQATRKIRARVQRKSFTQYLYFTDFETSEGSGGTIWFISGDIIHGPLHTNDRISINGNPVFEGRVTTARTIYLSGGSNPDFQQGYEENVAPLEIPVSNPELKTWAEDNGYYYYGETTIHLKAGERVDITNSDGRSTGPTGTNLSLPPNGVIFVDGQAGNKFNSANGDIYIEGPMSGELNIGAKNNIYITDDIVYQDADVDMLGLVAESYVYINHRDRWGNDVAPVNVIVNAAVFALNHSFGYEDFRDDEPKGTLTVYGAIAQRYRGPVGTFSWSTGPVSGYTKDYSYDERMLYQEPPHFVEPLNAGFEFVEWQEIQ